jgi:hypothetical protein
MAAEGRVVATERRGAAERRLADAGGGGARTDWPTRPVAAPACGAGFGDGAADDAVATTSWRTRLGVGLDDALGPPYASSKTSPLPWWSGDRGPNRSRSWSKTRRCRSRPTSPQSSRVPVLV